MPRQRKPRSRPQLRRITLPCGLFRITAQALHPVQREILAVLFILVPSRIIKYFILFKLSVQALTLLLIHPRPVRHLKRVILALHRRRADMRLITEHTDTLRLRSCRCVRVKRKLSRL